MTPRPIMLAFIIFILMIFSQITIANSEFENKNISVNEKQNKYKINNWQFNKMASEISEIALIEAKNFLKNAYTSDLTQMDLIKHLEEIMWAEGADSTLSFPTIVYSGEDHLSLHGNPLDDYDHIISPSKEPVVTIDLGA